jgi:glycosyltransferase involved in cell wall biosynthesis
LDAIELLKNIGTTVNITFMGWGSLEQACKDFSLKEMGKVKVKFRKPVEYGIKFFNFLQNYDVVLVPNLKQEQPRIVFDAFSQGLCVIVSDTAGLSEITLECKNALKVKHVDPKDLARAIHLLVENPDLVMQLGLNGLSYATGKTH